VRGRRACERTTYGAAAAAPPAGATCGQYKARVKKTVGRKVGFRAVEKAAPTPSSAADNRATTRGVYMFVRDKKCYDMFEPSSLLNFVVMFKIDSLSLMKDSTAVFVVNG
jgi:hypothetical protein